MNALIDTQALIWFCEDNPCLPSTIKLYMEKRTFLVVSVVSFWEITIKMHLGKLTAIGSISDVIDKAINRGFKLLPIEREHLVVLSTLDLIHRDPFDRLIIAQAIAENMPLVSSDNVFKQYPVKCIWQ